MVLIVIAAIIVVWVAVSGIINKSSADDSSLFASPLTIRADSLSINESSNISSFVVERGKGEGEIRGVFVLFYDERGVSCGKRYNGTINELESVMTTIDYSSCKISKVCKISVAPFIINKKGKEVKGAVTDLIDICGQNLATDNSGTVTPPSIINGVCASANSCASGTVSGQTTNSTSYIWQCLGAGDCSESYPNGTSVTLTATPSLGYSFVGWGGDCSGAGICTINMISNKTVSATFGATSGWGDYGDGATGSMSLTLDAPVNNYAYVTSASLSTGDNSMTIGGAETTAFTTGVDILVIQMQNGSAGQYEIKRINNKMGSNIYLTTPLVNNYVSNTFNQANAKVTQVITIPRYTNLAIQPNINLNSKSWDGYSGGVIIFKVNNTLTINSNSKINAIGTGFNSGIINGNTLGGQGESYNGKGVPSTTANIGGGGGGGSDMRDCGSFRVGLGGGGGYASQGEAGEVYSGSVSGGSGGNTYGINDLSKIYLGSGGGSGGSTYVPASGSDGGAGGGIIIVMAKRIVLAGGIYALGGDGQTGHLGACGDVAPGGGGSGGSIYVKTDSLEGNGVIAANGGNYALTESGSAKSGTGGNGRIRIAAGSSSLFTGVVSPTPFSG